jgi:uncharacterized protein
MTLFIDVSDILKEIGTSKEFDGDLLLEDMVYQGEKIGFANPIYIKGDITNIGKLLLLNGHAYANLLLECGACAEVFDKKIDFSFEAKLSKEQEPEEPDIFVYEGETVGLKDMVLEYLLLNLPIRKRCHEKCKGLCPFCGINLNKGQCQCQQEAKREKECKVDARLAALKSALSSRNEEV